MKNEIWKNVIGYENYYEVSSIGRVRSKERKVEYNKYGKTFYRIIKAQPLAIARQNKVGHKKVVLYFKGKGKNLGVHRLVAQAFLENAENKLCVNHLDGVPWNNNVDNLEWCTHKENTQHAMDNNMFCTQGESHTLAKLTEKNVLYIREQVIQKRYKMVDLAKRFNVTYRNIYSIVNRESWRHI